MASKLLDGIKGIPTVDISTRITITITIYYLVGNNNILPISPNIFQEPCIKKWD